MLAPATGIVSAAAAASTVQAQAAASEPLVPSAPSAAGKVLGLELASAGSARFASAAVAGPAADCAAVGRRAKRLAHIEAIGAAAAFGIRPPNQHLYLGSWNSAGWHCSAATASG